MAAALKLALIGAITLASTHLPSTRVLDITWHHQEHPVTCEAAALRMALSYYGINADELTLLSYMSIDRSPARFDASGRLSAWGDPQAGFVGDPDGHIERYPGYGVYNQPVARAAIQAGARVGATGSGLSADGVPATDVYHAVKIGHPVVVWISNTYHQVPLQHYAAFDGAEVAYTLTEHAVTVAGVRPDAVFIDDPWFGAAWHPKSQFESAYATFGGMAVEVAPPAQPPPAQPPPAQPPPAQPPPAQPPPAQPPPAWTPTACPPSGSSPGSKPAGRRWARTAPASACRSSSTPHRA